MKTQVSGKTAVLSVCLYIVLHLNPNYSWRNWIGCYIDVDLGGHLVDNVPEGSGRRAKLPAPTYSFLSQGSIGRTPGGIDQLGLAQTTALTPASSQFLLAAAVP